MIATIKTYLADLFHLFYPDVCLACSQALLKDEEVICFRCESELPQTDHWLNPENELAKRLWGRVEVQGAVALYQFQKGGHVQHLLHQLKYKGRKEVGPYTGKILGHKLMETGSIIHNIDLVVPVPLHWKKLKTRGYNQCDGFAEAVAEVLNVPYSIDALERTKENLTQAKKKRLDRWQNVSGIFSVKDTQQLSGKHVLVVDDIVTTGATAEACMQTILTVPRTKVSFAAIAVALK